MSTTKTTSQIKVVYLLDILFLLLIVFMIYSINSKPSKSIDLKLPKSDYGVSVQSKQTTISVSQSELYVNQVLCNQNLIECLKKQEVSPNTSLLINASSTLPLQKFVELMDQLQANKFQKLQLEVKQS